MHLQVLFKAIVFSSLIVMIGALPLKSNGAVQRLANQKRASYSVVAVDGSSAAISSTSALSKIVTVTHTLEDKKTVTASPTIPSGPKETVITTKVITETSANIISPSTTTSKSTTRNTESSAAYTSTSIASKSPPSSSSTASSYRVVDPARQTESPLDDSVSTITYFATLSTTSSYRPAKNNVPTPSTTSSPTAIQPCSSTFTSSSRVSSSLGLKDAHHTNNTLSSNPPRKTLNMSYDNGLWQTYPPNPTSGPSTLFSFKTREGTGITSPTSTVAP